MYLTITLWPLQIKLVQIRMVIFHEYQYLKKKRLNSRICLQDIEVFHANFVDSR